MTERRVHFVRSRPYLTIVGGTTEYDPEVAAPLSGGGFSDYFPHLVYQDVAVSAFLERHGTQYAGLNNPEGRGIPDIATQALKLIIFLRNVRIGVEGTSSSTPAPAWFPQYSAIQWDSGLNDFISGSNPGCGSNGFSAVPGWDPVTGLGTPDFEKLQNIFMKPLGSGTGKVNQPKIRGPGESQR
ncbi:tripeptidyl peptidase I, isoform CRA_e [Lactarius sanguifluus]|nr:tripeptidyl peptidase I, isoform CRA_e [Lactarius sanguifluus]